MHGLTFKPRHQKKGTKTANSDDKEGYLIFKIEKDSILYHWRNKKHHNSTENLMKCSMIIINKIVNAFNSLERKLFQVCWCTRDELLLWCVTIYSGLFQENENKIKLYLTHIWKALMVKRTVIIIFGIIYRNVFIGSHKWSANNKILSKFWEDHHQCKKNSQNV